MLLNYYCYHYCPSCVTGYVLLNNDRPVTPPSWARFAGDKLISHNSCISNFQVFELSRGKTLSLKRETKSGVKTCIYLVYSYELIKS